jgi:hypothetical protein
MAQQPVPTCHKRPIPAKSLPFISIIYAHRHLAQVLQYE